jgi:hypothetical protein
MFHLGFCGIAIFLSKRKFHSKPYPAQNAGATACTASQFQRFVEPARVSDGDFFVMTLAILDTTESKCRRITIRL